MRRHEWVMGTVTFDGLSLLSAPGRVMTPRATTERLAAAASARLKGRPARVADVGTGSGALAISIANACPAVEVWATDTNRSAVVLAGENVRRHGLDARVFVRRGDLLEPVPRRLDLVVANLPYLAASTAVQRPELWDEPFDAIFAPGDGLDPYRRLVASAAAYLRTDGALLLQLHRRLVVATRSQLEKLQLALSPAVTGAA